MSDVATLIADMVRAGIDPELIGRTAAALSAREPVIVPDEQAERRRAADRERKRLRKSAESAESAEVAPPKEKSPEPPKETPPYSPPKGGSLTPRAALEAFVDSERAEAVIEHRRRISKPLTAYGAKKLGAKFAKWHDPNEAADEMVANGWQGFKPEWMEKRGTGPPQKPKTIGDIFREDAKRMGLIPNDNPPDLTPERLAISGGSRESSGTGIARRFALPSDILGELGPGSVLHRP